jgi:hypothetical protein
LLLALGQILRSPANCLADDLTGPVHCLGANLATAPSRVSDELTATLNGVARGTRARLHGLSALAYGILLLGINHLVCVL